MGEEEQTFRGKEQINTRLVLARSEDRLGPRGPEGRIQDTPDPLLPSVSARLGRFLAAQVLLDGYSR